MQSYRDLIAWQKAMDLVEMVYRATRDWPKDELYGLTNQVRRSAVSVPSNVAEGKGGSAPTSSCITSRSHTVPCASLKLTS